MDRCNLSKSDIFKPNDFLFKKKYPIEGIFG
jgi:hypothetical protein